MVLTMSVGLFALWCGTSSSAPFGLAAEGMLGLSLPVQCWVFSILDDVVWLVPLVLWILAGLLSEIPLVCGHAGHVI